MKKITILTGFPCPKGPKVKISNKIQNTKMHQKVKGSQEYLDIPKTYSKISEFYGDSVIEKSEVDYARVVKIAIFDSFSCYFNSRFLNYPISVKFRNFGFSLKNI